MDETMVGSPQPEGMETTQADAAVGQVSNALTMEELFATPAVQGKDTTKQTKAQEQAAQPSATSTQQQPQSEQADLDRAFRARTKASYEKGFTEASRTDEFSVGKMLIDAEMQMKGISREEATRNVKASLKQQTAARFKQNPDEMFNAIANLVTGKEQERTQPEARPQQGANILSQEFVDSVSRGIYDAQQSGILPAGFNVTPEFVKFAQKHSVEAAIDYAADLSRVTGNRSANAEAVAARVDQRRAEPKPVQARGEVSQPGPNNFKTLTREQWLEKDRAIKAALAEGRPIDWGR